MLLNRLCLLTGASALAIAWSAQAQEKTPATQLDAVTVTATRSESTVGDVPSTVSVITDREIDRRNYQDIRDLTRYEPGVSVGNDPSRSGARNFVIRGIGENRVLVTIDGTRVPEFARSSPTFNRDYVDVDSLKRVEIVRGPSSALYGSDAIGGVVAFFTKDPGDYLAEVGMDWFAGLKAGFDSADQGFAETVTLAGRSGPTEALLLFTRRDAEELDNEGAIAPNPQESSVNNLLGKVVLRLTDADTLKLTGEYRDSEVQTDIRSDLSAIVTASLGDDKTVRRRFSAEYERAAPVGFVDRLSARAYYSEVERTENSDQRRISAGQPRLRATEQRFEQSITGGDVQFETALALWGVPQRLTYGVDLAYYETTRPRDRFERDLVTGAVTRTVAGESFPAKSFPDSNTLLTGVYLQDEIALMNGRLTLMPAVRLDYYRLDPHPDADFERNNTGAPVKTVTDLAVSPKLGAVYRLDHAYSVYGGYARGFRAPPYDDANIGFANPAFGYVVIPNPDLSAETSDGFEAGLRGNFADGSSFSVTGFYNLYQNFIDQVAVGQQNGLTVLQSRNRDTVSIWGVEGRGQLRLDHGFSVLGSFAYARGTDLETKEPIDSVDPFKAVVGLRYDDPADPWGAELIGTFVPRKNRTSDAGFFEAPSFATLDLLAYWDFSENLSVSAGIFNITDEKYWIAQDVLGFAGNRTDLDRFTQPGVSVAVNARLRF